MMNTRPGLPLPFSAVADDAIEGVRLKGDYVVALSGVIKLSTGWRCSEGVIGASTRAELEFENHVAEHGTLPPQSLAPDIEFVGVEGGQKGRLSDLRGKLVILDFWATWCGPCQKPMAKMQTYHEQNPGWKDRVAVVSLSIGDNIQTARNHLNKRGWTNTFNVWAGEGGWQSAPAKALRVRGVPTCYVIDAEGKVVQASHFLDAQSVVNRLLK